MVIDYIKFKKTAMSSSTNLYLIHGNPRNISNEIEYDLICFYKKHGFKHTNLIIEDDADAEKLKLLLNEQSLFLEKKLITLNITSKSIPKNIKDLISIDAIYSDNKIIIKLDRQQSSFKNTVLYKKLSSHSQIIEIYELKGNVLEEWTKNKCRLNNVDYDLDFIKKILSLNQNNSLAISQYIYQLGCSKNRDSHDLCNNSKYTEYDLVDTLLTKNSYKFLQISKYLQSINTSLPYLLFLLNSEMEKLYYLKKKIDPVPYIPSFLSQKYSNACNKYDCNKLLHALKGISYLDATSKYNSSIANPWISFNDFFLNIMNNVEYE